MTSLEKDGKYSLRIRKHLRAFLSAKEAPNVYINELIEQDLKSAQKALKK